MKNYLVTISNDEMRHFAKECISSYGTDEKQEEANKICDYIHKNLCFNGLVGEGYASSSLEETLFTSAFIHNLFFDSKDYDGANWTDIFKARQELTKIGKKCNVNDEILDIIFSTVEAQLGQKSPIKALRPTFGTPTQTFAEAVWIIKEYIK